MALLKTRIKIPFSGNLRGAVFVLLLLLFGLLRMEIHAAFQGEIYYFQLAQFFIDPNLVDDYDQLGYAVAIEGDWAAVGAPNDNGGIGTVYLFRHVGSGWSAAGSLTPSDNVLSGSFGRALDMDGDLLVVGAPTHTGSAGAAYIYRLQNGTWQIEDLVFGSVQSEFGYAVAINQANETLAVAAPRFNSYNGQVSLLEFDGTSGTWDSAETFTPTGSGLAFFGSDVALSDDDLVIGSRGEDAAYFYRLSNGSWGSLQRISGLANSDFGAAVDVDLATAVVGAPFYDQNTGQAIVFRDSGSSWAAEQTLQAGDPTPNAYFGRSVAIDGDILIGAHNEVDTVGDPGGTAYIFEYGTVATDWAQIELIVPQDRKPNDRFGTSVDLNNGKAVVGAPGQPTEGHVYGGSAYLFMEEVNPWSASQEPFQLDDVSGLTGPMAGRSIAVEGDTALWGVYTTFNDGFVHVAKYDGTRWDTAQVLTSTGYEDDGFGFANAIDFDGETAVIGSYFGHDKNGSVFVFERDGDGPFTLNTVLIPPDTQSPIRFGHDVAVDGDIMAIGVPLASRDGSNPYEGAVYMFKRVDGSWLFHQKILNPNATRGDKFGHTVDLENGTLVVGGPETEPEENKSYGMAYVYTIPEGEVEWSLTQSLERDPSDLQFDLYGESVAIRHDVIAVGAPKKSFGAGVNEYQVGGVYLYRKIGGTYQLEQVVYPSDVQTGARFGENVTLETETLIAAAYHEFNQVHPDLVYAYTTDGTGWQQTTRFEDEVNGYSGFGVGLGIDGETIFVGAPDYDNGRVHIYSRELLTQTIQFTSPTGSSGTSSAEVEGVYMLQAVSDSDLPVAYTSLTPEVCQLISDQELRILNYGECVVEATQIGSASYFPAEPVSISISIEEPDSNPGPVDPDQLIFLPMIVR